jgi:5-methylcytosine-specific restriction endonuclease McrA
MISHAKWCDRREKREYQENGYITVLFLQTQVKKQKNNCHYCNTKMQLYNRRAHHGLTCERLDMKLPHSQNNVVLCCSACNSRRFTPESLRRPKNRFYINQRKKHAKALKETHTEIQKYSNTRRGTYV